MTKLAGTKFTLGQDFRIVGAGTIELAQSATGSVSVFDYGAKGDGVTDDAVAIQLALTAASGGTCKTVFFPAGTYVVGSTLVVHSSTTLLGESSTSIIKLKDSANANLFTNSNYASGTNSDITFDKLTLDGNVANQTNNGSYNKNGIRLKNVSRVIVRDCTIRNVGTDCINLIVCDYAVIRHNLLHGAYNHAVTFEECDGLLGEGNTIHSCGSKTDALGFTSSGHAFIGVNVACNEVRIVDNYVYDMGDSCLRNEAGGEGWIISGNIVARSGKDSIKIMGRTVGSSRVLHVSDTANFAAGQTVTGGSSTATAEVTDVSAGAGTITVTMPGSGVSYKYFWLYETVTSTGGGSATITHIVAPHAKANVVSNNVVIDAGNNAIVANGSSPCLISNNVILRSGANTAGAAAGKWLSSAAGIAVSDNAAEVAIVGNHIDAAYASGIAVVDCIAPVVRGNTAVRCGTNGIDVDRCDRATIEQNVCFDNSAASSGVSAGIRVTATSSASTSWGRHRIVGNRSYNRGASGQRWGVRLEKGSGEVGNSLVEANDFWNNTSGPLYTNWAGSGNAYRRNAGYVTENTGTATVANGQTLVSVTHGLSATPTADRIKVTPTNSMGSATKFWIDSISSTTFQINVDSDPGATTATFAWQVTA